MFTEAVDGFAVQLTGPSGRCDRQVPGVTDLEAETPMSAGDPTTTLTAGMQVQTPTGSWGLDRLDQAGLPLDGRYRYDPVAGDGVTAYVVDTGIASWVGACARATPWWTTATAPPTATDTARTSRARSGTPTTA